VEKLVTAGFLSEVAFRTLYQSVCCAYLPSFRFITDRIKKSDLGGLVSLERPAVHLTHLANRRERKITLRKIFYARAATNPEVVPIQPKNIEPVKMGWPFRFINS